MVPLKLQAGIKYHKVTKKGQKPARSQHSYSEKWHTGKSGHYQCLDSHKPDDCQWKYCKGHNCSKTGQIQKPCTARSVQNKRKHAAKLKNYTAPEITDWYVTSRQVKKVLEIRQRQAAISSIFLSSISSEKNCCGSLLIFT